MKCLNLSYTLGSFIPLSLSESSLYLSLPSTELQSEQDDKVSIYPSTFHFTLKLPSVIIQVGVPLGVRTARVWMPFKSITH
uniref:Putative ovule protein n=1 Tax=Solanum chacoense TaxID=4108 RepID=A0A0V0IED2_SOLCH